VSGDELLSAAQENLPDTIALINSSKTVLQTQLDEGPAIRSWTHDLNLLTAQLKASDGDIRTLLDTGPDSLATINRLVTDNRDDLAWCSPTSLPSGSCWCGTRTASRRSSRSTRSRSRAGTRWRPATAPRTSDWC